MKKIEKSSSAKLDVGRLIMNGSTSSCKIRYFIGLFSHALTQFLSEAWIKCLSANSSIWTLSRWSMTSSIIIVWSKLTKGGTFSCRRSSKQVWKLSCKKDQSSKITVCNSLSISLPSKLGKWQKSCFRFQNHQFVHECFYNLFSTDDIHILVLMDKISSLSFRNISSKYKMGIL